MDRISSARKIVIRSEAAAMKIMPAMESSISA